MALELVNIQVEDLELVLQWRMKPEVSKYMYTDPILDLEKQTKWFEGIKDSESSKYWIIKIDNIRIGVINLSDIDYINKRCHWAYYIGDTSFRGRGIARLLECNIYDYVFNKLEFNKLCCEVYKYNEKVIEIHKKYGSEIEGNHKEHIFKNGVFYDIVSMAITKNKWISIRDNFKYDVICIE